MPLLFLAVLIVLLAALSLAAFAPTHRGLRRRRDSGAKASLVEPAPFHDPGRDRRAERKARELMRSTVNGDEYEMYCDLGLVRIIGASGYGYLIYPHKPIVAYATDTGELLNEYCIEFPDRTAPTIGRDGTRLPDADDVLAKWLALRADERGLISQANMHLPGRQIDPERVRRDLRRLTDWDLRQSAGGRAA